MSIDINAAFAEADWPTAAQVQQCFVTEGLPIEWLDPQDGPLAIDDMGAIRVKYQGRDILLEAELARVDAENVYSYTYEEVTEVDRTDDNGNRFTLSTIDAEAEAVPLRINEDLKKLGAEGVEFGEGSYVLTVSFSGDRDSAHAALLTVGGMIKCFNGYGFEFQRNSHGGFAFGQSLIDEVLAEGAR